MAKKYLKPQAEIIRFKYGSIVLASSGDANFSFVDDITDVKWDLMYGSEKSNSFKESGDSSGSGKDID